MCGFLRSQKSKQLGGAGDGVGAGGMALIGGLLICGLWKCCCFAALTEWGQRSVSISRHHEGGWFFFPG